MGSLTNNQVRQAEQRLIEAAKRVGLPPDSLIRFRAGQYCPQPKQLQFHAACRSADKEDGADQIGFGGARGPGKSHAVFAQIALDDCQRCPGLKVLYIRKVAKNAREQFEDLRRVVLHSTLHNYNRSTGVITFPNGSRIVIGHFKNERDVDQYLGLEYDVIAIEEATTLSLSKYKTLRDSNRTSKPNWRPRIYASTNPGNVGHVWFKERFITPARKNAETETRFIFATVDDNRFVDSGYKRKLEDNTGWKLRAYRFGDWDIAAGQYFSTWNHEAIVIKPFEIPSHWPMWAAMDYGFTHPTAVLLFTENDGTTYVIAEHVEAKWLPSLHAESIQAMTKRFNRTVGQLSSFVAGADVFAQKGDGQGKTIAQQYDELKIKLTPAAMDRVSGWGECLKLLGDVDRKIEPRIKIFNTCPKLIETIPALQHNPSKPEDVLKWDVDDEGSGGDDCFVAGTQVMTITGGRSIETLQRGDLLLTREGWKPVVAIWNSRKTATVLTARLSDGRAITATPNHRFWIQNQGWKCIDALRYGDIMTPLWQNPKFDPKLLNSMESPFGAIQTQNTEAIASIIFQMAIGLKEALDHYTLKFGNRFTAQCLAAAISIIVTATRSTTLSKIWFASLRQSIIENTLQTLAASQYPGEQWKLSDRWLLSGIVPRKVALGIVSTGNLRGKIEVQWPSDVNSAGLNILRQFRINLDSVLTSASQNGVEVPHWIASLSPVSDAGKTFNQTNMTKFDSVQSDAQDLRLVGLAETGKGDTFAIHVADCHEYYANGVLVKNCADAWRYGILTKQRKAFSVSSFKL